MKIQSVVITTLLGLVLGGGVHPAGSSMIDSLERALATNLQQEGGVVSQNVKIDRYTLILASLFCLQLLMCFVCICYTNEKVRNAEIRTER